MKVAVLQKVFQYCLKPKKTDALIILTNCKLQSCCQLIKIRFNNFDLLSIFSFIYFYFKQKTYIKM